MRSFPAGTRAGLLGGLLGTLAIAAVTFSAVPREIAGTAAETALPPPGTPGRAVAPYYVTGWGDPPDPPAFLAATGIRWLTLGFLLSDGTCRPRWDGVRPLTGGTDQAGIDAIRRAGGDVVASFGGDSGTKLEARCRTATALAAAYQDVIDTYALTAVDVDLENAAAGDPTVQQRTIDALKRIEAGNPGIAVSVTVSGDAGGPDPAVIDRAARAGLTVGSWSLMAFDFAGPGRNLTTPAEHGTDRLAADIARAYRIPLPQAYRRSGLVLMNGVTDNRERFDPADFATLTGYAARHHLARLTYWAANRDRPCGTGSPADDSCSGVPQRPWEFGLRLAQYTG